MYGEKVEEAEELRLDLQDVKEMYKMQIDQLTNNSPAWDEWKSVSSLHTAEYLILTWQHISVISFWIDSQNIHLYYLPG